MSHSPRNTGVVLQSGVRPATSVGEERLWNISAEQIRFIMSVNVKELKPGQLLRVSSMSSMVGRADINSSAHDYYVTKFEVNDVVMFLGYKVINNDISVNAHLLVKDRPAWFKIGLINHALPEDIKENAYVIMFLEEAQPID